MIGEKSLKANCKARFHDAFSTIKKDMLTSSFMLVVDKQSVKIISSYLRQQDLHKFGIMGTESLELARKPYPGLEAVYYITPCEESVKRVSADYTSESKQYGAVHILFSNTVSKGVLKIIAENKYLIGLVKSCKDYNIDFLCSLDRHYSLNVPNALTSMMLEGPGYDDFESSFLQKLATCVTCFPKLYAYQIIYHQSPRKISQTMARKLADRLQQQIKVYEKEKSEIFDRGARRINVIIIDRLADPMAPLLRDIHYQPMLYDLFGKGRDVVTHRDTDIALDENDQTFSKYRTDHIAKLFQSINEQVKAFMNKNPAAKMAMKQTVDLTEVVKSYPEYAAKRKEIDLHIALSKSLLDRFDKDLVKRLYVLEHTLATGKNQKDEQYKEKVVLAEIQQIFKEGTVKLTATDKARLVAIIHFTMGLSDADSQRLAALAGQKYERAVKAIRSRFGPKATDKPLKKPLYKPPDGKSLQYQTPKLLVPQFVRSVMAGDLSQAKSIKINWEDKGSGGGLSLFKGKFGKDKAEEYVLGMIGPLGYNEVAALPKQVISGGSSLASPSEYLEQLAKALARERVVDE